MSNTPRDKAIRLALDEAGIDHAVRTMAPLSGGCIHEVLRITLDDGSSVVAKVNTASQAALFEEESHGLTALAHSGAVLVPSPLGVTTAENHAVFLMEHLEAVVESGSAWRTFGEELAALHNVEAGTRYGFEINNHLGTTFQPNDWNDDWVAFNAEHRLGHQVQLARGAGLLNAEEVDTIQRVIDRLDQYIPRQPKPALLHGDLWSGNVIPARHESHNAHARMAMIDPAPYIGDGWADIAMMQLFGGFPHECFDRYIAHVQDHEMRESRIAVYQLYHILNHVNIFGRGYVGQAMAIARSLP